MSLALVIGLIFSPIAALMAYVIVYDEAQHHYSENKQPKKLASEAAIFTFFVFLAISVLIGFFLGKVS